MKLKAILLSLLLVSPFASAWDKISDRTYSIYGTRIGQSKPPMLQPFAEMVYNTKTDSFGLSFISSHGKRETISYGIFNMRTCDVNTSGAIAGTLIIDTSHKDQMDRIFQDCKRPMFFRVWDTYNEHVTYKFENAGPLPEEK